MKLRGAVSVLLALVFLGTCAGVAEQAPPDASGAGPLSSLKLTVDRDHRSDFDFTDRALDYLNTIAVRFGDRGEGDHDAFIDWLVTEMKACGYDDARIREQPFEETDLYTGEPVRGRNVIVTIPGRGDGQIIAGAHFDGNGVGDNGSGTALLMAAAAGLADAAPRYTIRFIFFDCEEAGDIGSGYYAGQMSGEEVASTLYMINIDALAFGDFCNIYGGVYGDDYGASCMEYVKGGPLPEPEQLEGYNFAADAAEALGFRVYRTADLDGYFEANGHGMALEDGAFFTNPWTNAHPAPAYLTAPSPAIFSVSDHTPFAVLGIPYIYFEATNWWAKGADVDVAYTGYVETYDETLGDGGRFMNTDCDTFDTLNALFPGRLEQHYHMYSPLLSALLLVE